MTYLKDVSKRIQLVAGLALFVSIGLFSGQAAASPCSKLVPSKARFISQLNLIAAGKSYKINRRKTLHIKRITGIQNLQNRGAYCRITAKVDVKLRRKVRRNAHGYIKVRGDLKVEIRSGKLVACIINNKLTQVKLSHTLKIGERFYRRIANKAIPKSKCIVLA